MKKRNLTKKDKREIIAKWQQEFPYMGIYSDTVIANIVGPFVMGVYLEIKSDKTCYCPRIFIDTLGYIDIYDDIPNSLLLTYENPFETISKVSKPDKYIRIANQLKEKCKIPLYGDLSVEQMFDLLLKVFTEKDIDYEKRGALYLIITLALWSEQKSLIEKVKIFLATINDELFCDENIKNEWVYYHCGSMDDPSEMKKRIEENIQKLKIDNLPRRNLR